MPGLDPVRWAVLAAAGWCLGALAFQVARAWRFGGHAVHSAPAGEPLRGVAYAFGPGMMPWGKESAARHLPTYMTGIVYHLAVFLALALVGAAVFRVALPSGLTLPLTLVLAAGAVGGVGLMVKRASQPVLRSISCPDDFASNALVDLLLLAAIASLWLPAGEIPLLVTAAVLFLYIPAGKIRHCFFFFYSRILFGIFFGRRGVLPVQPRESRP
jgi:hypothetical protein